MSLVSLLLDLLDLLLLSFLLPLSLPARRVTAGPGQSLDQMPLLLQVVDVREKEEGKDIVVGFLGSGMVDVVVGLLRQLGREASPRR